MICDSTPAIEYVLLYSGGYDPPYKHAWPYSLYYMMHLYLVKEIVFHIIEHGILSDNFVTMTYILLFEVLL